MALAWSSLCLVSNSGKNTLYKHSINLDVCEPKTSSLKPIEVTRAVIFRCCFVEKVNKQFEGHLPEWATESHIFRMIKEIGIVDDRVSSGHCKNIFWRKSRFAQKMRNRRNFYSVVWTCTKHAKYAFTILTNSNVAVNCCFCLCGNLDFQNFLQKRLITSTVVADAIAQWIRLCLPSCGPVLESQVRHLHFSLLNSIL